MAGDLSQAQSVDQLFLDFKRTGDRAARDRLVDNFAPLVKSVAAQVHRGLPGNVESADLIADGTIGLMDALEKFDPERGLQFSTYAARRVRGAIVDGLRAADWVPRSIREKTREVNAAVLKLQDRHERSPRDDEVAVELGISTSELHRIYAQTGYTHLLSLDLIGGDGDSTPSSVEGLPGADDGIPDGFADAVRDLPERDRIVIALYYWERLTLTEIGQVLGVSESRVSQIHHRATSALRCQLLAEA